MKWLSYLRITGSNWIIDLSIWAILLLPIVAYPNVAFPFGFGRFVVFMFIMLGLLMGVLATQYRQIARAWWRSPLLWLVVAWLVVMWISSVFGVNFHRSFWGVVSRSSSLLYLSGLMVMLVILLAAVRGQGSWLKILGIMSWMGGLSAAFAVLQKMGGAVALRLPPVERVGGLMGNPIFLGMFLLLTFFLAVYFFIKSKSWMRWAALANVVLQAAAIILTASRGPFLGFVVGLAILGLGWLWLKRPARKRILMVGGLSVLAAGLVGGILIWLPLGQRLLHSGLSHPSVQSRLLIWSISWQAFLARPWLGYGLENVEHAFNQFYQSGLGIFGIGATVVDRAHGFIFEQLLVSGVVGTALILALMVTGAAILIYRLTKGPRIANDHSALMLTFLAAGGAYAVSQITAFDSVGALVYGFIILGAIIFFTSPLLTQPSSVTWQRLVAPILLAALLWVDLMYLLPAFAAGRQSILGDRACRAGQFALALQLYEGSQHYSNPYQYFLLDKSPGCVREYAVELIHQQQYVEAKRQINAGLSMIAMIRQVNFDNPFQLQEQPLLLLLRYVTNRDQPEYLVVAQTAFDNLVVANPNREYLYLNWARMLMKFGLWQDAEAFLHQAASFIAPPRELEFWRATLEILAGGVRQAAIIDDLQVAADKRVEFYRDDLPELRMVVSYLTRVYGWEAAAHYQRWVVQYVPRDATERRILAGIYVNLQDLDLAEAQARAALRLDPSQREEVGEFLKGIGRSL